MTDEFEAALPLIIEIAVWCEAHAERQTVTVQELSAALGRRRAELYRAFDLMGLQPATWEAPDEYALGDIIEVATRHEVAHRA